MRPKNQDQKKFNINYIEDAPAVEKSREELQSCSYKYTEGLKGKYAHKE